MLSCALFLMLLRFPQKLLNRDLGFNGADTHAGIDAEKMNEHQGAVDVGKSVPRFDRGHIAHAETELGSEMCLCERTALSFQSENVTDPFCGLSPYAIELFGIVQQRSAVFQTITPQTI